VVIGRVRLWPAVRLGCVLGWLGAVPGAAVGAAVLIAAVRFVDATFGRVQPITADLAGRELFRIDLVERLGLSRFVDVVGQTADLSIVVGVALFVAFALSGGAIVALAALLTAWGYNVLTAAGLGLEVEVRPALAPDSTPAMD